MIEFFYIMWFSWGDNSLSRMESIVNRLSPTLRNVDQRCSSGSHILHAGRNLSHIDVAEGGPPTSLHAGTYYTGLRLKFTAARVWAKRVVLWTVSSKIPYMEIVANLHQCSPCSVEKAENQSISTTTRSSLFFSSFLSFPFPLLQILSMIKFNQSTRGSSNIST